LVIPVGPEMGENTSPGEKGARFEVESGRRQTGETRHHWAFLCVDGCVFTDDADARVKSRQESVVAIGLGWPCSISPLSSLASFQLYANLALVLLFPVVPVSVFLPRRKHPSFP
jgi:hypothetical protein